MLPASLGTTIPGAVPVRVVRLHPDDPWVGRIAELDQQRVSGGHALITFWAIRRTYTRSEIEQADSFLLRFRSWINCAGEQFGTTYDTEEACPLCHFGRRLTSALRLSCKCRPRIDISVTLAADEILVSDRMVNLIGNRHAGGVEFRPVDWVGNCPSLDPWRQLIFTGAPVRVDRKRTRFGESPFGAAARADSICPFGHVLGLNLLSELCCEKVSFGGSEIARTDVAVGSRSGLLVPAPLVVVSGPLGRSMLHLGIRGVDFEVAHLA